MSRTEPMVLLDQLGDLIDDLRDLADDSGAPQHIVEARHRHIERLRETRRELARLHGVSVT